MTLILLENISSRFTPTTFVNSIRSLFGIFALALLFAGCNDSSPKRSPHAFFGGHIVNPQSEYFILSKDTTVIDTVFINDSSNFSVQLQDVEQGFYTFWHSNESQIIYLTPGDSLLTWVNTLEFDESLHFSGIGAEKNNFLINLYLWNEQNTDLILNYHKNDPAEFEAKTDSIRKHRMERLANLAATKESPEDFLKAAEKMIAYEQYDLRERYTYMINKYYREFSDEFPESFYEYRKEADFNEHGLQTNPAYLRFLENYLINLSMTDCEAPPENNECFNTNSHENIIKRIHLIDKLTTLPIVKNYFFSRLGALGMVMGKNRNELTEILELLREKGLPKKEFIELLALGNIQLAFFPGTNVGIIPVVTLEEETIEAKEIIKRRSVFYLWSIYSPNHHKKQHAIIEDLRKKYKRLDFLGLNIDVGETSAWRNVLQKYNYNTDKEFQLAEIEIAGQAIESDVLKYYLDKLLFLDATGKVVIGDAYINSPDFESRILEFLNL